MPTRTIKIDCFQFSVHEKGKEKKKLLFDEFFYYEVGGKRLNRPFADFFKSFIESFNNSYKGSKKEGQAVSLVTKSSRWNATQRYVSGSVRGGNWGASYDIEDGKNAGSTLFPVKPEHVSSEPFQFLLWMPHDYPTGVLIVQGYSNSTIAEVFRQTIHDFFRAQCGNWAVMTSGHHVDPEVVEKAKRESVVDRLTITQRRVKSDIVSHLLNMPTEDEEVSIEIRITGLSKLDDFASRYQLFQVGQLNDSLYELEPLKDLGITEEAEAKLGFTKVDGRQMTASSKQSFKLRPQHYLTDGEVACEANGRPNEDSMQSFLRQYLEKVKEQISYKALTRT